MNLLGRLFGTRGQNVAAGSSSSAARYRCVRVNVSDAAPCGAARSIAGRKFLPDEIPSLPLPDCDADRCECSYELFSDRRRLPRIRRRQ